MRYEFDFSDLTVRDKAKIDVHVEQIGRLAAMGDSYFVQLDGLLSVIAKYVMGEVDIFELPAHEMQFIMSGFSAAYCEYCLQLMEDDSDLSDIWNQWGDES